MREISCLILEKECIWFFCGVGFVYFIFSVISFKVVLVVIIWFEIFCKYRKCVRGYEGKDGVVLDGGWLMFYFFLRINFRKEEYLLFFKINILGIVMF